MPFTLEGRDTTGTPFVSYPVASDNNPDHWETALAQHSNFSHLGHIASLYVFPDNDYDGGYELPRLGLVELRQRVLARWGCPIVLLNLCSDEETVQLGQIRFAGTIDSDRFDSRLDGNIGQALTDLFVRRVEELSQQELRQVQRFGWVTWASNGMAGDIDNGHVHRWRVQPWVMAAIRNRLEGDLDPDLDETTDLPVVWEDTTPIQNQRTFGLEFEFLPNGFPQEHFGDAMREALVPLGVGRGHVIVRGYAHSDGTFWDLKTDSSCGYEVATPALHWEDWPKVEAALDALVKAGARIDHRCGVHVHHMALDLRPTGLRRLLLLWAAYERVLLASVKAERHANRYCRRFDDVYPTWNALRQALNPIGNLHHVVQQLGRYQALNATGWWQHGRIEVRLHHGTLRPSAIRFWTLLTQQMVEFAKETRSYKELEQAFHAEFKLQLEQFKQAVTHRGGQHPDILKLPMILEEAIRRRNAGAWDSPTLMEV